MVISSPKAGHQSRVDECFRVSSSENTPLHDADNLDKQAYGGMQSIEHARLLDG